MLKVLVLFAKLELFNQKCPVKFVQYLYISISNLLCRNLGMCKKTNLSPLYILQKRIVRTITFAEKPAHTDPIFKDIEVLPLGKLIHCRIGLFMYKIFYILQPTDINKMYDQNVDIYTYNTRQKYNLHVATGDSDFYTKSFYCSSILIWNDIMDISLVCEIHLVRHF